MELGSENKKQLTIFFDFRTRQKSMYVAYVSGSRCRLCAVAGYVPTRCYCLFTFLVGLARLKNNLVDDLSTCCEKSSFNFQLTTRRRKQSAVAVLLRLAPGALAGNLNSVQLNSRLSQNKIITMHTHFRYILNYYYLHTFFEKETEYY